MFKIDISKLNAHYTFSSKLDAVASSSMAILAYIFVFNAVVLTSILLAMKYYALGEILMVLLILIALSLLLVLDLLPYFGTDIIGKIGRRINYKNSGKTMDKIDSILVLVTLVLIGYFSYITVVNDNIFIYKDESLFPVLFFTFIIMLLLTLGTLFNILRAISNIGDFIITATRKHNGEDDNLTTGFLIGTMFMLILVIVSFIAISFMLVIYLAFGSIFNVTILSNLLVGIVKIANIGAFGSIFMLTVAYYLFERHRKNVLNSISAVIQKEYKLKEEVGQ
jgi:hypothetical protein